MCLSDLSSCELVGLASSVAILIGNNVTSDEASLLSSFFNALGDNLAIISSTLDNTNCD
jgi:hypothetical protein